MKRLVLLALLASCTDYAERDHDSPDLVQPAPVTTAERRFVESALPVLATNCSSCHAGSDSSVAFLAGTTWPEIRASLLSSPVVNVAEPVVSRILTKGAHSGPSMTAAQTSEILEWLVAERD